MNMSPCRVWLRKQDRETPSFHPFIHLPCVPTIKPGTFDSKCHFRIISRKSVYPTAYGPARFGRNFFLTTEQRPPETFIHATWKWSQHWLYRPWGFKTGHLSTVHLDHFRIEMHWYLLHRVQLTVISMQSQHGTNRPLFPMETQSLKLLSKKHSQASFIFLVWLIITMNYGISWWLSKHTQAILKPVLKTIQFVSLWMSSTLTPCTHYLLCSLPHQLLWKFPWRNSWSPWTARGFAFRQCSIISQTNIPSLVHCITSPSTPEWSAPLFGPWCDW